MYYRTKSASLEALQWTGENYKDMYDFLTCYKYVNEQPKMATEHSLIDYDVTPSGLMLKRTDGIHPVDIGSYVVKNELNGQFFGFFECDKTIFEKYYEEV